MIISLVALAVSGGLFLCFDLDGVETFVLSFRHDGREKESFEEVTEGPERSDEGEAILE